MLKIIAIAVVVLIAAVLIYAATKPDTFRVERKTVIKAPPEKVLAEINDFHRWGAWSPYEKKDPAMKRSFTGPASGTGAQYGWEGNNDVGTGSMEILQATPQQTRIKLDFLKPFEAHNQAVFSVSPQAGGTELTWAMEGPLPYFGKVMHVFFNMDKMVGTDFEVGLANLKALAEK
jgi:hypothetical protein